MNSKPHHPKNRYERRKLAAKKSLKRFTGASDARREIPAEEVSAEETEAIDSLPPLVARELREHAEDLKSS